MRKNLQLRIMLLLAAVLMGVGSAWAEDKTLTIGFEDDTYTDWVLTTIKAQQTNTGVNAHSGSYYGGTDGKESGSVVTNDKIASPQNITFYVSKESTNTNASSVWQIKVSSDGTEWTQVGGNQDAAANITKGEWTKVTRDLSSYTDVYVGVFYSGTAAKRCIDDITITYTTDDRTAIATLSAISPTEVKVNDEGTFSLNATFPTGLIAGDDYEISWSSNNDAVLGVDATSGEYQAYTKGTANITVSVTALDDATYKDVSEVFTVTVTEDVTATVYEKVTDVSQLVAGNEYILVATENSMAMGAPNAKNAKIRDNVEVIMDNNKVSITNEAAAVLTLGGTSGAWTFLASDNSKYLALTANSNEIHASDNATLATSKWVITDDFQLESTAQADTRYVRYNSGTPRFACYKSGQVEAYLFVKSGSATDTKLEPGFSFSVTSAEATLGTEFTAPTFSNPNEVEVTFASSDEDVATVDADGVVTLVYAGTTTITATSEATDTYKAGSASYTLTVIDPNAAGTVNNPYTVAQAIEATPTTGNVYIRGIVSSFYNTSIVGDGSNYRYYISDDGTTTTQLLVYKGKGLNEAAFTNANDLLVGDEVVICGTLTMYQSTPEIASGNYLYSWNRPADTTPSITLSTTTIQATADGTAGTINVTYANLTDVDAYVIFCDANGGAATYDWVTAEIDTYKNLSYIIHANEGEARTAYMKVRALDDANEAFSELITITQDAYVAPDEDIDAPEAGQGCFVKVTSTEDITAGNYLIVYEDGNVAFNGSRGSTDAPLDAANNTIDVTIVGNKIAATDETVASIFTIQPSSGKLQSASGKYIGVSSNSNGLKTSDDGTTYINSFSIDNSGNAVISAVFENSNMTLRFNDASNQNRFRYYTSGQKAIQLYKYDKTVEFPAPITVTDAGWATYIAEANVVFPAAVSAYIATAYNKDNASVTLRKVEAVNQGTPVIVKAEAGTYQLETAVVTNNVDDNMLVVYRANKGLANGYNPFVLAKNGEKACFKQWVGNKTDIDGRVVLPLELDLSTTSSGVRALTIVFSDTATGIETVGNAVSTMDNGAYTLSGQRVQKPTKGLYIIGGKKVVVK